MVGCMAASEVVTLTRLGAPRHGQARHRRDGPHQAAARRAHPGGGQRQVADGDAAPAAAHPALPPRQGAGPARLVPDHAVLAGRLGRQRRGDGALPRLALRRRSDWRGAPWPRRSSIPRSASTTRASRADRDPRRRPARARRAEGDGRPAHHARLRALRRHRALRRGDRGAGGARPAGHPGLRLRPRLAPGDRGLFPRRAGTWRSTPSCRSPASASSAGRPTTTAARRRTSWPRSTCPTSPRTRSSSRPSGSGRPAPAASARSRRRCWWRCRRSTAPPTRPSSPGGTAPTAARAARTNAPAARRAGRCRPAMSASRCSRPGSRGWPRCAAAARPSAGSAS